MGRTTNAVVCSYKTLQEATGLSRTSVANAIKLLKEDNWIDAVKIGNATAYCVNERVFWQSGRNHRQYAIFSATVIASASEQESDYHTKVKTKLTHVPFIESKEQLMINQNEKLDPPDQIDLDLEWIMSIDELKKKIHDREEDHHCWLEPAYTDRKCMKKYRVSLLQTAKLVKQLEEKLKN
jgi:DNA-binding transcriptional regulator GbsR (MarR family)